MNVAERKINSYKRKLDKQLRHLKIELLTKRQELPSDQWLRLIYATKRSVLENPGQYVTGELPERFVLIPAIDRVFKGFLEDQKIRNAQRRLADGK
jgi:hypothetical protein